MEHPMILGREAYLREQALQLDLTQARTRLCLALAGQDRDEMVEAHLCVLDAEMAFASFHSRRKAVYSAWLKATRWVEDKR